MRKAAVATVVLAGLLAASPAAAEDGGGYGPWSAFVKAGTLGIGLGLENRLGESFGVAVGGNYFKYDFDFTAEDIDYDAELNLGSATIVASYYPWKGRFRVIGGLALNGNDIDAHSRGEQELFEIGGMVYSLADVGTLNAKIDFNSVAPYLGVGWGADPKKRWGFTIDAGVLFQGSPQVDLTASGPIAEDPEFLADLEEEEQAIEDELHKFQYYPILALGLYYRF